jgi:Na+/H+ antiporter NhaD/arsenite permease-like protein
MTTMRIANIAYLFGALIGIDIVDLSGGFDLLAAALAEEYRNNPELTVADAD